MEPRVHAVVLNYNHSAGTVQSFHQLRRAPGVRMDVLVVDCLSAEKDRAALRQQIPAERLLLLPENRGYAGGMNAGIEFWLEREPEVPVLLLTPDARVADDAVVTLWQALLDEPSAGVVGPVVIYQEQPRRIGAGVIVDERGRVSRLQEIRDVRPYEVSSLDGCCMLLRPDAVRAVSGFDEQYFLYFEETDLCQRIRDAGWRIWLVPSAFVHHPKTHDSAAPHVYYYMARNTYLFRTRHFDVSSFRAAADLMRSNLQLTAVALGATLLPQHWHQARARWHNCRLAWRGAWAGTRDHLRRQYGPRKI